MTLPAHTQVFEDAITITPVSSHVYSAYLRDEWCIGAVPHGGYTTSVLAKLAKTHFAHTHPNLSTSPATPISIQLSFLRRTDVGPALLTVEDMKIGARTSTIHVLLKQRSKSKSKKEEEGDEEVKVAGYITLSPAAAETGITAQTSWALYPPPPGPVNLRALASTGRDGAWVRIPAPFVQFRRAAANVEFYGPDPASSLEAEAGVGRRAIMVDQWARFRPLGPDGKPLEGRWTDDTIGFLVDMFPMMLDGFDVISSAAQDPNAAQKGNSPRGTFWYPTVTLNVDYKKRLPVEGVEWLYSRVQTKAVKDGRTDIDVTVLDESGDIVALSTQVGLVVSASRNLAGRDLKKVKVDAQGKANL
ncbi:hypothetical protein DTO166G4_1716 [Paecilomyces variotii]|nr:hypothetical protein DTO166G4_1716 [Paecilomyces variotii]KAJ9227676.1 hypothetical protein DTO166G5_9272 [Paecilomyces variotii]KAJ9264480.1 hypothetical protein DTO195F2_2297 [Paecilomyces variotii]KAJ9309003.1 hypothetical protein DTO217A2_1372 [Paecilomyces variotii]KAJ9370389.1 hypothetical protein DTO282E5_4930 [Paecilomyces variotii]